ncbi:MAG: pilus assembly protein, partial [Nitrospiraceae bacterium]
MAFSTANSTTISPYLRPGAAPFTGDNIINFIRGSAISGLRNRNIEVGGATNVWKLGDIVNSTPVIVGAPKERYDTIYGDSTYTSFFTQYKNRRMVAYVGANDGMLHAINAGYYHRGDDPGTSSATEHGWFTRTATDNSGGPLLGDELWGFIPYQLLPQLLWLTQANYGHTYYVDLKPKVTDARIFTADVDHPNGWGTILIGGFRLGGSCQSCPAGNGKAMTFNPGGGIRVFYSAYFVLDITNPEADPKLLWSYTDDNLGLTSSYPAVIRVNPTADAKTSNTNAKWFALFGSGPTGYNGGSQIEGTLFMINLKDGPGVKGNKKAQKHSSGTSNSFLGDIISLDADLDYRADVTYFGSVVDTGATPKWEGRLYRLTTGNQGAQPFGGDVTPANWGKGGKPTWLLYDFGCTPSPSCAGPKKLGPIVAAPTVSMDTSLNIWVFTGTGRFWDSSDKTNTDTQYFLGVKDNVINGTCTQGSDKDCQVKDLVNVSATVVCSTCASGTNQVTDSNNASVTTLTGTATTTLQGLVASKQGWYTTLPTSGERALYSPTLLGGIVFFPTFVPDVGGVCGGGTGTSSLYALFYLTGSAYKVSVVGTDTVGGNTNVKRSTALGAGVASQVGIHMGAQGTDSATGITSRSRACSQMSTGALTCIQTQPAQSAWSRYLSWINLRL